MSLIKMHCYLFYKFYKLFEYFETTRWLTTMKAVIVIYSIEIWLVFSIINYIDYFSGSHGNNSTIYYKTLIPFILMTYFKWIFFWKNNDWKKYVKEFDNLPENINRKGSLMVTLITIISFLNLIFSFFLNPPHSVS